MLSPRAVVVAAYCIAAVAIGAVVAVSIAWGVRDSARYYLPAALILLAAGVIHYVTCRGRGDSG